MALPSSGTLKFSQVKAEFSGTIPYKLAAYLKGGSFVSTSDTAPNVPSSLPIKLSNFYGAAKSVGISFTTWTERTKPTGAGTEYLMMAASSNYWYTSQHKISSNKVWRSSDGVNWSSIDLPTTQQQMAMAYFSGCLMIVCFSATSASLYYSANDGTSWSSLSLGTNFWATDPKLEQYDNTYYIWGDASYDNIDYGYWYSTAPTSSWTSVGIEPNWSSGYAKETGSGYFRKAYTDGDFVSSSYGTTLTSWTRMSNDIPTDLYMNAFTAGNGVMGMFGFSNITGYGMYFRVSGSGTSWTHYTSASNNPLYNSNAHSVKYDPYSKNFFVVGLSGTYPNQTGTAWWSTNLSSWTSGTVTPGSATPIMFAYFQTATQANGKVIVGGYGTYYTNW